MVLLAQTEQELKAGRSAAGGLLMDVKFESVEGLLKQAQDKKGCCQRQRSASRTRCCLRSYKKRWKK
jgi:hypothetical protein